MLIRTSLSASFNALSHKDSNLLQLARRAGRLPHPVIVSLLCFIFLLCSQLFGAMFLLPALIDISYSHNWMGLANPAFGLAVIRSVEIIALFVLTYVLVYLWLKFYERRPFWTLGFEWRGAGLQILRGGLVGLLFFSVVIAGVGGMALFAQPFPLQLQDRINILGGLVTIPACLIQVGAEEMLCRGWLLPVTSVRTRTWFGILLSSLVFMGLHALSSGVSPLMCCNFFIYGLFAACYALLEGELWGICAFHGIWLWSQTSLVRINELGIASNFIFNLKTTNYELITGGSYGLQGGLMVTIVLSLGVIYMLYRYMLSSRKI